MARALRSNWPLMAAVRICPVARHGQDKAASGQRTVFVFSIGPARWNGFPAGFDGARDRATGVEQGIWRFVGHSPRPGKLLRKSGFVRPTGWFGGGCTSMGLSRHVMQDRSDACGQGRDTVPRMTGGLAGIALASLAAADLVLAAHAQPFSCRAFCPCVDCREPLARHLAERAVILVSAKSARAKGGICWQQLPRGVDVHCGSGPLRRYRCSRGSERSHCSFWEGCGCSAVQEDRRRSQS